MHARTGNRQRDIVEARLPTADVRLRRWRAYQWLRRFTLGLSILLTVLVPLAHLRSMAAQEAGVDSVGTWWASLARILHLPADAIPWLGAPWTVNVLGLEFMDPLAGLSVIASGAVDMRIVVALVPTVLLLGVFGRFFCGWLCPYVPLVAITNALRALLVKLGMRPANLEFPATSAFVVLGLVLLACVLGGTPLVALVYPPAAFARESYRAVFTGTLGAGAWMLAGAMAFDLLVARAGFCRYVCPGGAMFRIIGAFSPVRVKRDVPACTDCAVCDVACNMGQGPMTDHVTSGCDRCGRCVSSCPTGALSLGRGSARLRVFQPGDAP